MSDASIFPVVAILIFTIFFVGLFIWVIRMDKKHVSHMASLPLIDKAAGPFSSPSQTDKS